VSARERPGEKRAPCNRDLYFNLTSFVINFEYREVHFPLTRGSRVHQHTMPPAALTPELEELASFFQRCGLSEQRATETARSKGAPAARNLFTAAHLDNEPLEDKQGALVLQLAKDGAKLSSDAQLYIVDAIRGGRLLKSDQITGKSLFSRSPKVYTLISSRV
jgi:hypothetical protein